MRTHPQNKQQFNLQFGMVFTRVEIDRAVAEMNVREISISSIYHNDIYVGFTQNPVGNRYVSAYMAGYWLGYLEEIDGGAFYEFNRLSLPNWVLFAIGTRFENKGRWLAALISSFHSHGVRVLRLTCGYAIETFREKIAAAGLLKGNPGDESQDAAAARNSNLRIAMYCRHRYQKLLLEQSELCERWIANQGFSLDQHLVERYQDKGEDASKHCDERPDFQRMLQGARAGRFDVLVLTDYNRISHRGIDIVNTLFTLQDLGVHVQAGRIGP